MLLWLRCWMAGHPFPMEPTQYIIGRSLEYRTLPKYKITRTKKARKIIPDGTWEQTVAVEEVEQNYMCACGRREKNHVFTRKRPAREDEIANLTGDSDKFIPELWDRGMVTGEAVS